MTAAQVAVSPFAEAAPDLLALGYSVLALVPADLMRDSGRGKRPGAFVGGHWRGADKWERHRDSPLEGFALGMAMKSPGANIGLVLGTMARSGLHVICVDVDVTDTDALDTIVRCLPASPMAKRGLKGISLFYAADKTITSRSFDDHRIERGSGQARRLVDVLTGFETRQTVCPPSVHPESMQRYVWTAGPVPACELPVFDEQALEKLTDCLTQFGYDPEAVRGGRGERKPYVPTGDTSGDPFEVAKRAALANLSAWVPEVENIARLRPARGGYEGVSLMRDSSTGKPTHDRKRNLSIQVNGIRDFGTDETFSAVDLVSYHNGLTVSEALVWLEDRLGLSDDDTGPVIDLDAFRASCANNTTTPPNAPDADRANDGASSMAAARAGDTMPTAQAKETHARNRVLDLQSWTADRLVGEPPAMQWLVEGAVPMAVPGMVAAQGDAGKSFLLLDLARRIAFNASPMEGPCFGGMVAREGTCVIITAEDDAPAVHRRIASIDPVGARFSRNGERLIVVPLPDAGGPLPLVGMNRKGGLEATDGYKRLAEQLAAISDLQMVVFDPLQAFVHAPINEDPAAGQFTCSLMATLAAETQATVLLSHHMRKGDRKTPVSTPQEAREMVRGTTALVDGLRWVYALWPETDGEARKVCDRLRTDYQANRVINGAVVKSNGPALRKISTYVRQENGLLLDQTAMLREPPSERQEKMALLAVAVGDAAKAGNPFTRTGASGLKEQSYRLPGVFKDMGRPSLLRLCEDALERGVIVAALAKGSTTTKWLDVPGGPFALGIGEFALGQAHVSEAAA